mmetsp:Transcript_31058/g.104580  ORF Transcript_31058/g.104580 Transcript_31058/m.104580 type:complete len:288 (+) Transcript_31058:686-1549(+)
MSKVSSRFLFRGRLRKSLPRPKVRRLSGQPLWLLALREAQRRGEDARRRAAAAAVVRRPGGAGARGAIGAVRGLALRRRRRGGEARGKVHSMCDFEGHFAVVFRCRYLQRRLGPRHRRRRGHGRARLGRVDGPPISRLGPALRRARVGGDAARGGAPEPGFRPNRDLDGGRTGDDSGRHGRGCVRRGARRGARFGVGPGCAFGDCVFGATRAGSRLARDGPLAPAHLPTLLRRAARAGPRRHDGGVFGAARGVPFTKRARRGSRRAGRRRRRARFLEPLAPVRVGVE